LLHRSRNGSMVGSRRVDHRPRVHRRSIGTPTHDCPQIPADRWLVRPVLRTRFKMYRFERFIAVCAAVAFIGFAVAGYVESKKATELGQNVQASNSNVTASP
jgi:hypothetical protein